MFLKTGGGKFLKNSAATGGMIQENDIPPLIQPLHLPGVFSVRTRRACREAHPGEDFGQASLGVIEKLTKLAGLM
jgi:hypothetical protein